MTLTNVQARVRGCGTLAYRLYECLNRLGRMCSDGRGPTMTIPASWSDDDVYISTTIGDALSEISCLREALTKRDSQLSTDPT